MSKQASLPAPQLFGSVKANVSSKVKSTTLPDTTPLASTASEKVTKLSMAPFNIHFSPAPI